MSVNPCFECGQCCRRLRVSFYHSEPGLPDDLRIPISPFRVCIKGTEQGAASGGCVLLRHDVEQGYRCSQYELRPSPCREFNPIEADGTPNETCRRLRQEAGLPDLFSPDAHEPQTTHA